MNHAPRAAAGAAGWGGGRFELWRRGGAASKCAAPCVNADLAWIRLRWDTDADRVEGEAALRQAFAKGLKAEVAGRGAWSSRGGAIALRGRGRETTVVLAPEVALAARALAAR